MLSLADKMLRLFRHRAPQVDVRVQPVWAAGELLEFGGHFNNYVTAKQLQKQEGMVFRHLLRLILLLEEFKTLTPPDVEPADWTVELDDIGSRLTESCRAVDATSTDKALANAGQGEG